MKSYYYEKIWTLLILAALFNLTSCSDSDEPTANDKIAITNQQFNALIKNKIWIEDANTPYEIYNGKGELLEDAVIKYFDYGTIERRNAFQITDDSFISYSYISPMSPSLDNLKGKVLPFDSYTPENGDVNIEIASGYIVPTLQLKSLDDDSIVIYQDFGCQFIYDTTTNSYIQDDDCYIKSTYRLATPEEAEAYANAYLY